MKEQFWSFEHIIVLISLFGAIIMSFIALFTPPPGEISSSVLFLIGEIMIFICTIMGVKVAALNVFKQFGDNIRAVSEKEK
jgi:hypothetical protein